MAHVITASLLKLIIEKSSSWMVFYLPNKEAHMFNFLKIYLLSLFFVIYNLQFDTKKTGFIEFDEFILVRISE